MTDFEDWLQQYNVEYLPTVVVLRADGIEKDRIVNFPGLTVEFIEFIDAAARGDNSFETWIEAYDHDPNNVATGYKLFMKYLYRGDLEQAIHVGRKILDRPELARSFPSDEEISESRKTVYGDVLYHLRTSIHRSNKATIFRYIPLFPEVRFAERAYWFVDRSIIRKVVISSSVQSLLEIALNHYPGSRALQKLITEYTFRNSGVFLPFTSPF